MVNGERANKIWTILIFNASVREAAKKYKNILFMAGPLRPNLPPPSSLMAVEILERWKKKF